MPIPSRKQRNSEAAGRDISEGSEHTKERKRNFFFLPSLYLFQLVFFTKTNTQSKPTSVSSSPATAESHEQDIPLPQNNLRIQNPKPRKTDEKPNFPF